MEFATRIAALSNPAAYPVAVPGEAEPVEVHQTHLSVVFLAGRFAYKIKKPVDLGFVDYRSIERRRFYCDEEVRLNRRLAPTIYRGVVPITRDGNSVRAEGDGEVVDWAVKMDRLSPDDTLKARLDRGAAGEEEVIRVAQRIAAFHARADGGPGIARFGRFETVARNARENFEQAADHVGSTLSRSVFDRLERLNEASLAALRTVIEGRADRGGPRDGHGDLRLGHIYLFPERPPPNDLAIIDCIEFADRFRCADPLADIAFLIMDLCHHDQRGLAALCSTAYLDAAGETPAEVASLLRFYTAYRAVVRAKVEGMELNEPEIPSDERTLALVRSRAHWLLALGQLESPRRRPAMVLVGGLPGAGKSTLGRSLAEQGGLTLIRSDEVRKQLAGLIDGAEATAPFEEGIYTSEWTDRTYAECLRRAEAVLFEGERVLIDASFGKETHRRCFLDAARRGNVPAVFLNCQAAPEVIHARLDGRRGDTSDADWSIHLQVAARWEEPTSKTRKDVIIINTGANPEASARMAVEQLRERGLW